ncbi:MAG: isocitrate lyase/phosphoenolpyruvate mutase family protein [Robiginitomaculum sp.]|nr:isocitrate lyase/phosphoenolpyruvate mutase family protein [Robiginitomaculum sp.]
MSQVEKAMLFKSLHTQDAPLTLYNIWDAGGAKAVSEAGAKAIATGSWSVAAAHGYEDGEAIPLDFVLKIIERIAGSVDLPVSVDFEGGYASAPEQVTENVRRVISAGAVGINFEDQTINGQGLYTVADQTIRIKAVRNAAKLENMPLFINARTDIFLKATKNGNHADLVDEALLRAAAYAEAGADGFFVPGLTDLALIERVAKGTPLPVNVMLGSLSSLGDVTERGIARASLGPVPYFAAMNDLARRSSDNSIS